MKARLSKMESRSMFRFLVCAICVFLAGAVAVAGQAKKTSDTKKNQPKASAVHKSKKTAKTTKSVKVTGSNISYQVKEGADMADAPLNLTVIDVSKAENRGYSRVMDILRRDPRVYPSYRGY
ncbi:MAG TPA: hypothetical protein PLW35_01175 [Verrucomicrobiota bacterium]|nr:hypothetical protein [Verrucomicrobiota bacterium]HOK76317.1 hypothetical protein [Verrucomicrobiota bacterium]